MSNSAKTNRAEERRRQRRTLGNLHLESKDALTAGSLIDGARMYAASADAVNASLPSCVFPISHLLCTSIELSLKAFLRHKGATEDHLTKLGHDLSLTLKEAVAAGLLDTGSRMYVLAVVGRSYAARLFVYPEQGLMTSIETWRLRAMCHEILVEVYKAIKGESDDAAMSGHPGLCIQGHYPTDLPITAASGWTEIARGAT
jgi:hypothetical protein